jgi:hypothetical protein
MLLFTHHLSFNQQLKKELAYFVTLSTLFVPMATITEKRTKSCFKLEYRIFDGTWMMDREQDGDYECYFMVFLEQKIDDTLIHM